MKLTQCLRSLGIAAPLLSLLSAAAHAQDDSLAERVGALERANAELRRQIDVLADEQERLEFGEIVPPIGESEHGLGPAASKVYGVEQGLSIGGYGEAVFTEYSGADKTDVFDFLRSVFYFGYKYDENWVFNSEIEFEHASTSKSGSASVEFAYLDYLHSDALNARAGLVLVPMGFVNELHEPPTMIGATRPETERRIIPSTWRENGAGLFGDVGPVSYRAYVVNGLNGSGFSGNGLRGGRQKGSKAKAEDFAAVARVDWTATPGVLAGASVYHGDSGQGQADLGGTATTIAEVHAEYEGHGLWVRGLAARAMVDDVGRLNASTGESVGQRLEGHYLEGGYDVLALIDPESRMSLGPYVRWESIDTQADTASGYGSDPLNDDEIVTIGIAFRPIDSIVIKVEGQDWDEGVDRMNATIGYAF
jgi:hypothetical protein